MTSSPKKSSRAKSPSRAKAPSTSTKPPTTKMSAHVTRVLENFAALDAKLQACGFPATSPWWHQQIARWYRSGKRQLTVRAGRRAGKSSTISRLGVVEALYGEHKIPPGDTGVVAVISTRREESAERLTTIKSILDALGVAYVSWGEHGIKLTDRPIGFRVYTASIAGVSGFTGIFVFADEVAKWKDSETGVNPANEVLKAVRPTMLTQPNARIILSSSPMGKLDAHYDAFEEGETPLQITAHATSWEANPSVTEEETHILEPDQATWEREYAAIPQAESETSLLTEAMLERATRKGPIEPRELGPEPGHVYYAAIDAATRGNSFTLAVGTRRANGVRHVVLCRQWTGTKSAPLVTGPVFKEIAAILAPFGIRSVTSDQWAADPLREIARENGVFLHIEPTTAASKADGYEGLLTLLRESDLQLPPDTPSLPIRTDLLGIKKCLTRSGIVYDLAKVGPRHSDFAPSIAKVVQLANVMPRAVKSEPQTDDERNASEKIRFLRDREKAKRWEEKHGVAPITHRHVRGMGSVRRPFLR